MTGVYKMNELIGRNKMKKVSIVIMMLMLMGTPVASNAQPVHAIIVIVGYVLMTMEKSDEIGDTTISIIDDEEE